MNKNIIRAGDFVRIVNPNIFVRCGYPQTVLDKYSELITDINIEFNVRNCLKECGIKNHCDISKIVREIAYLLVKENKFGGGERRIYTEKIPDKLNKVYEVTGVKFVKTGYYVPGIDYSFIDGDYEPAQLIDVKSHKILCLSSGDLIEVCNVERK